MTPRTPALALAATALVALSLTSPAQNPTPPGYLDRVRQYRTYNYGLQGGENVNVGTPRSISTYLPVDDTNSTSVTMVPNTITITTNSGGVTAPIGGTTGLTVSCTEDYPIRSLLVGVYFESAFPLQDLQIKLAKGTTSVVLKDYAGVTTVGAQGAQAVVYFDQGSLTDLAMLTDFKSFTNPITIATAKLAGGGNYSAFTNTSTRGDWTLSISTPVGTLSSNILYAFIVYADSDAQAVVTANNKVYDLRPRSVSARNYTVVDENGNVITLLTRTESER
jgi:hypothetical protein